MPTTPIQAIVDTSSDAGLSTIYPQTPQQVPITSGNTTVYITNKVETVTNVINQDIAGGSETEVQFNIGDRLVGDSGFTYDADTDSLQVTGNITVGYLRTNNLLYANGNPWSFGSGSYANSNVANYLPVYSGNLTANNFAANTISGNGYAITYITGSNVNGAVGNATHATSANSATTAGTVTTGAQPNITSVGTLSALSVTGTATATLFSGSGANLTTLNGANVSGAVSSATSATTAATVTTAAQPNITSVGTLSSLAVTGNVGASFFTGNGSLLTGIVATTAGTVTTAAQPNITSTGTLSGLAISGTANTSTINSNGVVTISNTAPSTNNTSGALIVAGGIGSNANVHGIHIHASANMYAQQRIFAGQNAIGGITFSTEVFVGKTTSETFIQAALINSSGNGSADYTSFGENGNDTEGWTSMGMTGTTFSDANYTISSPSDGYVFVQGMTGQGGNLIFATGEKGNTSVGQDIIFATGGFLTANEKFRIQHSTDTILPYSDSSLDLGNSARQFGNFFVSNVSLSGTLTGVTPNNNGYMQWLGNSSGDGAGYTTLNLVPDSTLTGGDQYVILDPTAPGHIHVRAGGTQDGSSASLYLGGENSYFMVPSGSNTSVYVAANSYSWGFGNDGVLDLPGNVTRSIGQLRIGTPNANIIFAETTGPTEIAGKGNVWIYANLAQYNFSTTGTLETNTPFSLQSIGNIDFGIIGNATSNVRIANTGMIITGNISANNLGNIVSANLDGSTSNVLYGNGVFASTPSLFSTKTGYSSGATVTQTTNRGQGVTINSLSGTVITTSAVMVPDQIDAIPVTNSQVDPATDIVYAQVVSYHNGCYLVTPLPTSLVGNGFYLYLKNIDTFSTANEAVTIRFIVQKAPNS
jgi:hypothetical protein